MASIIANKIGTKQAHLWAVCAHDIAAANAIMTDLHFGDHFRQHSVQVFASSDMRQQGLILIIDGLPIEPMHIRIIEEFRLHPPDIIKDLTPLFARIDPQLHVACVEGFGLELAAQRAGRD